MAFLLFFTAVVLSGIAAYYSVIGLIAIFSAAALPVAIMGGSLEAAKLVVASWLYRYWKSIPFLMKAYFTSALVILMIITSMGIFGFLSKAHSDQSLVGGDVQSKIALYDEKIKIERENIANAQQVIKQMDAAVNGVIATGDQEVKLRDGSTRINSAAERSLQIRRSQVKDRNALTKQIELSQSKIVSLQEEAAPIRAEIRKVEAEVGPLKYIAAMIYGDNPDENSLERSVRWLIILLIAVFDPLAVLMLIAANLTQIKSKEWQEEKKKLTPNYEKDDGPLTEEQTNQIKETVTIEKEKSLLEQHPYLTTGFSHFKNLTPMVAEKEIKEPESKIEEVTHDDMEQTKDTTNEVVLPVVTEEPTRAQEDNRQDVSTGFTPKPAMETVGIEKSKKSRTSKKKVNIEQVTEDKSSSVSVEDQVNTMIANEDTTGLESIYKQIVKELAKNNRNKSTHWGPLKTKK